MVESRSSGESKGGTGAREGSQILQATQMTRQAYDGFYYWQARVVETTNWRGKQRWLAVLDRCFGSSWRASWLSENLGVKHGRLRKSETQAQEDAERMLDHHDLDKEKAEGRYV